MVVIIIVTYRMLLSHYILCLVVTNDTIQETKLLNPSDRYYIFLMCFESCLRHLVFFKGPGVEPEPCKRGDNPITLPLHNFRQAAGWAA